jgi:hypothetical protein
MPQLHTATCPPLYVGGTVAGGSAQSTAPWWDNSSWRDRVLSWMGGVIGGVHSPFSVHSMDGCQTHNIPHPNDGDGRSQAPCRLRPSHACTYTVSSRQMKTNRHRPRHTAIIISFAFQGGAYCHCNWASPKMNPEAAT